MGCKKTQVFLQPFLVPSGLEINPWFYQGLKTALAKPKWASSKQAQKVER